MTELALTLEANADERLAQAEALVRSYCRWHIAPSRTETVTFDVAQGPSLLLPSLHVTAVASVTENGTALAVTDDYLWSANGVLTRYWWCAAPVVVEFTHGYEDPPPDVTAIVQAVAQRAVDNPGGASSQAVGPFQVAYSSSAQAGTAVSLLPAERAVLDNYRLPPRP